MSNNEQNSTNDAKYSLNLPSDMKKSLEAVARTERRSLNAQILIALEEHLNRKTENSAD